MTTAYSTMRNNSVTDSGGIDLRSDTVTLPSLAMYDAMVSAPVGDDVYGGDETVNALEAKTAELLGKEAALFVSSGTQSNLIAMLTHCQRGEEVITGDEYHVNIAEARGASVLGGIAMSALPTDQAGGLLPTQLKAAVKPDDSHYPVSSLLCLENTVSGSVQSAQIMKTLCETGRQAGLSLHLDGARLMNASVALGLSAAELADPFDSISLCLSKGLGAPVGSVLCSTQQFIDKARRNRKLLGGGMRQAGVLAACGMYALDNNIERLNEDHHNAEKLASGLEEISEIKVKQQTNMVFVELTNDISDELQAYMASQDIVISAGFPSIRLVTHLNINASHVDRIVDAFQAYFKK